LVPGVGNIMRGHLELIRIFLLFTVNQKKDSCHKSSDFSRYLLLFHI
jgi:hypothetical protein